MRLLSGGPVAVATRGWQGARERMLTIVARVTYNLVPVRSELAAEPARIRTKDSWFEGARGLDYVREPSDIAPAKEASDVVVVGKAYGPADTPVREVVARLVVGEIDKTLRVTGPRRFGADRRALSPEPFREAPLDWTHASSGDGVWNPVGVSDREPVDLKGESVAPSVLPFGIDLPLRGEFVPPAGFGPIAPDWGPRREITAPSSKDWIDPPATARLVWDESQRPLFFQVAPPDQRLNRALRSDERIVLESMHPKQARFVTSLPGIVLHAAAVDAARDQRPIELRADTMWIDTQQSIVTVTHRTTIAVRSVEACDVFVWLEGFESQVKEVTIDSDRSDSSRRGTATLTTEETIDPSDGISFRSTMAVQVPPPSRTMPFQSFAHLRASVPDARASSPSTPASPSGVFTSAPPLVAPARPRSPGTIPLPSPPLPSPPLAVPPLAVPPRSAPALGAPMLAGAAALPGSSIGMRPSGPAPSGVPPTWQAGAPPSPAPLAPLAPPALQPLQQPSRIDTWKLHEEASRKSAEITPEPGVVADARASQPEAAPAAAAVPAAAIEVVWLDATAEIELASRSKLLAEQLDEGEIEWMSPTEAASGSADRDRSDVARYFRKAQPRGLDDLARTLIGALEKDENERPFVVLSGELTWTFDPRASIRAWIAVATSLAADPRIKEAIDAAEKAMSDSTVTVPEVLALPLDRLREAVRALTKLIGATPVEAAVERYLLEERGFGRRKVWGASRLRGHLSAKGSRSIVPVYLAEAAGPEAPLIQKFPVRLLAELRTRQDPSEACPVCLRAVAYGIEIEGPR